MTTAALYESELEEVLFSASVEQFGVNEERLLPYLFRRSFLAQMKEGRIPRIPREEIPTFFMTFWLKELAIPVQNNGFFYKGILIPMGMLPGKPLRNIYDNLLHRLEIQQLSLRKSSSQDEWQEAKLDCQKWIREAKLQSRKYREQEVFFYIVQKKALDKLNEYYQAHVKPPMRLVGFQYNETLFKLTAEEVCHRVITAFNETVNDGELISESELEQYVMNHLDDIESGLRLIGHQYQLPYGRIDLLAQDREGNYVILELKVEKDTDLIWQKWYYTEEVKKRFRTEHVRFIAIMPRLYPELLSPLLEGNSPAEILQFHPTIQRGKLLQATFTRYQP